MTTAQRTRSLRTLAAAVATCGLALANIARPAAAAGCQFESLGESRVAAIIDTRTFRLDDGREIRLEGIEPTEGDGDTGATLGALIASKVVTLRGESDAPDRYGRQAAFAFLDPSGPSVQALLLARGEAVVSTVVTEKDCAAELTAAETSARQSRRGTWAQPGVIRPAENPGELLARVGKFAIVEGKVLSARQAGSVFYLNFGRRWTRDFAVTISKREMPAFEAAGFGAKSLENRRIRVRGWVERRGGPRIEALRTGQIEWAGTVAPVLTGTRDDRDSARDEATH